MRSNEVAVIMGTYNRAHLLKRSLEHYSKQGVKHTLIIFDDGSTDDTQEVCNYASDVYGVEIVYSYLKKEPGKWRDSACYLNAGIAYALHVLKSKYIFITHPEIIPGRRLLKSAIETFDKAGYARLLAKGYYLTKDQQELIETVDLSQGIAKIRTLPDFYEESDRVQGLNDYKHRSIDNFETWNSWIWGGFTAENWQRFGGVYESETWGAVDVEFWERSKKLNVPTITPQDIEAMVIHQNHDLPGNVMTPRNEDWIKVLSGVPLVERPELISKERWERLKYLPDFN